MWPSPSFPAQVIKDISVIFTSCDTQVWWLNLNSAEGVEMKLGRKGGDVFGDFTLKYLFISIILFSLKCILSSF